MMKNEKKKMMKIVYNERRRKYDVFTVGAIIASFQFKKEAEAYVRFKKRGENLRRKLQRMLKELALTSTNKEAEAKREEFKKLVKENKWAKVSITNGKVSVVDKEGGN